MADQTESNSTGDGVIEPGQAQSSSTPQSVQPPSIDADAIEAFFDTDKGREILERQTQSVKDRRFVQQERQLSGIEETLERLDSLMKDKGLSREQAVDRIHLEDRLTALEGRQVTTSSESREPAQADKTPAINVQPLLESVGIDNNDPRVTEFLKTSDAGDPEKVLGFISTMKLGKSTPTTAQAMPTGGGQSAPVRDIDVVNRELAAATQEVPLDRNKLRKLRLELQALTNT